MFPPSSSDQHQQHLRCPYPTQRIIFAIVEVCEPSYIQPWESKVLGVMRHKVPDVRNPYLTISKELNHVIHLYLLPRTLLRLLSTDLTHALKALLLGDHGFCTRFQFPC
eukprot:PhF_6_TR31443/c0_g1_i1/m.46135